MARAPGTISPSMTKAFDRLGHMSKDQPAEKAKEAVKPGLKVDVEPKPEAKAAEKKVEGKAGEKVPGEIDAEKTPPRQLREAYEQSKARLKALEAEANAAKQRLAEFEKKDQDWTGKLTAAEKRAQELDEKLRYTDYQQSDEYKSKYVQPFADAYETGQKHAERYMVTDAEGNKRRGTAEDFDKFMGIVDPNEAAQFATETWGNAAGMMFQDRYQLEQLAVSRQKALEDYKKNGSERQKQAQEQASNRTKAVLKEIATAWDKEMKAYQEHPRLFKERDGDEEGNALLKAGIEASDRAFKNLYPTDHRMSPEKRAEVIRDHVAVFQKAAAFDRTVRDLKSVRQQLKAARTELKQYQASEPQGGKGAAGGPAKPPPGQKAMDRLMTAVAEKARTSGIRG